MNNATTSLTGALTVRPGLATGENLSSTRSNWAARMTYGKTAGEVPSLVSRLYNLCGQSHYLCNQMALGAIFDESGELSDAAERVQIETTREHIQRIALDWPRLILSDAARKSASGRGAATALRDSLIHCPLFPIGKADAKAQAAREWLETAWLGLPARGWLGHWHSDGTDWLSDWIAQYQTCLTALFRRVLQIPGAQRAGSSGNLPARNLAWSDQASAVFFADLANASLSDRDFSRHPRLDSHCAQTGTWTRHADQSESASSLIGLLASRIADLLRLCLPDAPSQAGSGWLTRGALRIAPGKGVAWLEMARGLLVHAVHMDSSDRADARVVNCQVVAPTEWNFHPHGSVAQQLKTYDAADRQLHERVGLLMAAYDPCVPFTIDSAAAPDKAQGRSDA